MKAFAPGTVRPISLTERVEQIAQENKLLIQRVTLLEARHQELENSLPLRINEGTRVVYEKDWKFLNDLLAEITREMQLLLRTAREQRHPTEQEIYAAARGESRG